MRRPAGRSVRPSTLDADAERTAATIEGWNSMDGKQGGDPAKFASALIELAALDEPPLRFPAGVDGFEKIAAALVASADARRNLSSRPCPRSAVMNTEPG